MDRTNAKRQQVIEALADVGGPDRNEGLTVSQVMTTTPSCIGPETTALELVKLFHAKQFRHLLVTGSGDRLVGVISDRDVIRCLGPDRRPDRSVLAGITAAQIMSTDLVTIVPTMPLERAVVLMIEEGISCLPVLIEGTLVGILTNTDLHLVLQVLLQHASRSRPEQPAGAPVSNRQNRSNPTA